MQGFRLFVLFPLLIVGCSGLSHSWDGSWKLVPLRSQIPGSNFQITLSGPGEYDIDYGPYQDRFRCDGREYPLMSGKTISCSQRGALAFDSTAKKGEVLLNTAHWELSADQKTLSIRMTAPQLHGTARSKEIVYERTTGTAGFAGAWSDVRRLENRPQLLVLTVRGRHLYYSFPEVGQYADVEVDGSDAPWNGPSIPMGSTIALEIQEPGEILVIRKLNGRIQNQGTMKISPDGHTLVEEFWSQDRPDAKSVLVWEK